MKVLFDTNVILDILLNRKPFVEIAVQLFSKVERSELIGVICATTVTTIHYLVSKELDNKDALKNIEMLISLFEISAVNRSVIEDALNYDFKDFEDAVLSASAYHSGVDYIVTRNCKDFKKSIIPVYTPEEFMGLLNSKN